MLLCYVGRHVLLTNPNFRHFFLAYRESLDHPPPPLCQWQALLKSFPFFMICLSERGIQFLIIDSALDLERRTADIQRLPFARAQSD